jgi:hypothetical protein
MFQRKDFLLMHCRCYSLKRSSTHDLSPLLPLHPQTRQKSSRLPLLQFQPQKILQTIFCCSSGKLQSLAFA